MTTHKKLKIAVIGAGFGGLAAANRLAAKGHHVHLFEKRDKLGGRGYQYELNGFKFDGGPTVITAPYMFDEIFKAAGKRREDYFKLVPLDPFYRIFNHEGQSFDYRHQLPDMLAQIERFSTADKAGYQNFVKVTKNLFNSLYPYTDKPFLKLSQMLRIMPDVIRYKGWPSTYSLVADHIHHPFLRQVFSFHPLLIGGNPFGTPALYTLIVQFEKEWGVHYAIGGTGAIVNGLGKLFADSGGSLHLNTEIRKIIIKNHRAEGLEYPDGSRENFDAIVCNGDVAHTYRYLIDEDQRRKWTNKKIDSLNYSNSLFVIYFGTKRLYRDSGLAHHNIMISKNYREVVGDIFDRQQMPSELALYLHMPSITDPSIAPAGCESFYVLSLVPHQGSGIDWTVLAKSYRDRVMQYLEDHYLPDLQSNILAEHFIDPLHFQKTLNSYNGAAFALKPTLMQSGYFRPHNRSEEFENLYFVGAGTYPGAGVPAVISSGKIAAELIDPS